MEKSPSPAWIPPGSTVEELVAEARRAAGMSMRELARRSGLSAAQVSRIESGGVTPSMETLAKLALALERQPEPLYVAAGYADTAESLELVQGMLKALPSGAAFDLVGALQELYELDAEAKRLEKERHTCERTFRAELERRLDLEAELALAKDEASQAAVEERESDDPDAVARARDGAAHEETIAANLVVAERHAEAAENGLLALEAQAVRAQEALVRRVREVAARLFLLTSRERLARVRALTDPSPEPNPDASAWLGAMRNLTDWVEQDRTTGPTAIDRDLRTIVRAWVDLPSHRRRRVLEYVEDQRRLSTHETAGENGEKGGGVAMPSQDESE